MLIALNWLISRNSNLRHKRNDELVLAYLISSITIWCRQRLVEAKLAAVVVGDQMAVQVLNLERFVGAADAVFEFGVDH